MRRKVRIEHARRLAVARQRLSGSRPKPLRTDHIHELVQAIGCLQLDPTGVVARNHLLVVFSRLGPFDPKLVDALLWDERRLYEYWAHRASIVPTEDRPLHAALPPPWGDPRRTESWMTTRARFSELVLQRLAANGSVRAADFEEHAEKYESGWGDRSPIADTLALLWLQGRIVPAGRVGSGRRWALADSWFRIPLGQIPERPVALREVRGDDIDDIAGDEVLHREDQHRHPEKDREERRDPGRDVPRQCRIRGPEMAPDTPTLAGRRETRRPARSRAPRYFSSHACRSETREAFAIGAKPLRVGCHTL